MYVSILSSLRNDRILKTSASVTMDETPPTEFPGHFVPRICQFDAQQLNDDVHSLLKENLLDGLKFYGVDFYTRLVAFKHGRRWRRLYGIFIAKFVG